MEARFRLKVVTPLFLGGAQQQPELRPTSVRGTLRFWFRAVLGGVVGNDIQRLAQLESEVFGETERGSSVIVRISPGSTNIGQKPLLPHNLTSGYATAFLPSTTFDLILSLKPCTSATHLEMAVWSTLLWLTLGGIGRRSRRGAGSMFVESVGVTGTFSLDLQDCLGKIVQKPADSKILTARIDNLIEKACKAFQEFVPTPKPPPFADSPSFSVLHLHTPVVVWTPANANDEDAILSKLMNHMSDTKRALGSNFDSLFGGIKPRLASPLIVKVEPLENGLALVLTYLKAANRPNGISQSVVDFLNNLTPQEKAHPRETKGGSIS